ncbi:MAG: hypothetical protein GF332_00535 [Candidatus Moranbacteria bacterium]|nr:hypothetical protein [Candidatus Moranbacteria bacterium]
MHSKQDIGIKKTITNFLNYQNQSLPVILLVLIIVSLALTVYFAKDDLFQNLNVHGVENLKPQYQIIQTPTDRTVKANHKTEKAQARFQNTANWNKYVNKWYGFSLNYPEKYQKPVIVKKNNAKLQHLARYRFKPDSADQDSSQGFDVIVYSQKSIGKIENSDEIWYKQSYLNTQKQQDKTTITPTPVATQAQNSSQQIDKSKNCNLKNNLTELDLTNSDYQAYEINITRDHPCYRSAYFFSLTRGKYVYHIVPLLNNSQTESTSLKKDLIKESPEIYQVLNRFQFIKIQRPKPKPKAPKPHGAKKVNGKYVCAKKNDKPSKSKKNPDGHMDMQCCLDPDEIPNPWCTY